MSFAIQDPDGAPIAGGRTLAFGHVSPPSGTDGRTSLGIYPGTREVVAGAPRFRTAKVMLPARLPARITIRLEPACTLVVRVRHEDPTEALRGLLACVTREVDEVGAAADAAPDFGDVRMTRPARTSWLWTNRSGASELQGNHAGHQKLYYELRGESDLTVGGFAKGDELRVYVEDRWNTVIRDQSVSFGDGDVKVVEIVLREHPRTIRGVVVGDRGEPLPGAEVGLQPFDLSGRDPHLFGRGIPCDAAGRFELSDVYAADPVLSIEAGGHVARHVRGAEIFESDTFRLDRARRLVVQMTGSPMDGLGDATLETPDGTTFAASRRAPGMYVFESVPCRAATIRIEIRGEQISSQVGAEDLRVEVAIPR